jgi:hypothetical protein
MMGFAAVHVHVQVRRSGMFSHRTSFAGVIDIAGLSPSGPIADDMSPGDG